MRRGFLLCLILLLGVSGVSCVANKGPRANIAPGLTVIDEYTIAGTKSFLTGYPALNLEGTINAVIEIPAGTTAKWEVIKPHGELKWEFKKGKPRTVKYLSYPGNYGMIPRTLLPKELGGDGDPLDVLVLCRALPRGSVVEAKVLGILKLLDNGEKDDKILAVPKESPLYGVDSIRELDIKFPGVTTIVETWFLNYKGPKEMESQGFAEVTEAMNAIKTAMEAFDNNAQSSNANRVHRKR